MVHDWQVVTRKGRAERSASAIQPLPYASAEISTVSVGPAWKADHLGSRVSGATLTDGVDLTRWQGDIENRLVQLQKSAFLHKFQQLWTYVENRYSAEDPSEPCKFEDTFSWKTAIDLVVYGLGSPTSGATRRIICVACLNT